LRRDNSQCSLQGAQPQRYNQVSRQLLPVHEWRLSDGLTQQFCQTFWTNGFIFQRHRTQGKLLQLLAIRRTPALDIWVAYTPLIQALLNLLQLLLIHCIFPVPALTNNTAQ